MLEEPQQIGEKGIIPVIAKLYSPALEAIVRWDEDYGHTTRRQVRMQRLHWKPHWYDRLVVDTSSSKYQAMKSVYDFCKKGYRGAGIQSNFPHGLASEAYSIINKLEDEAFQDNPKLIAGFATTLSQFFSALFTVTVLDMGEFTEDGTDLKTAQQERANLVLNLTQKQMNDIVGYFGRMDQKYGTSLIEYTEQQLSRSLSGILGFTRIMKNKGLPST